METPIFWLLMMSNPQAIQDLDNYQEKVHGTHIDTPSMTEEGKAAIPIHTDHEDIDRLMRQAPNPKRKVEE